jgi:hypothetical protein
MRTKFVIVQVAQKKPMIMKLLRRSQLLLRIQA